MSREIGQTEQDFWDALGRLERGCPEVSELCRLRDEGRLRVNISNVAIEARHSRRLIGHDGCEFKEVRKAIQALKPSKTADDEGPVTAHDVIDGLRAENRKLKEQVRVLGTRVLEAMQVANLAISRAGLETPDGDPLRVLRELGRRGKRAQPSQK